MILPILTTLIFMVTLALFVSAAYFFVEVPVARQKLKARLAAVQQVSLQQGADWDAEIMRREMLSDIPAVSRFLATFPTIVRLQLFLQQAAINIQVSMFLLIVIFVALLSWIVVLLANIPPVIGLVISALAASAPFLFVSYKRQKRFARFEEQFPDAIDLLGRAVRAGHAFTTAFSLIGDEMADPVAEEFRLTHSQQNLGLPLRDALGNFAVRMPLPDVRIFVSALQIQRDSGRNLGEILDNLSYVIRERFKILREVQIVTAEGRLSMYVLTAIPVIAGILMYLANPDYMRPLFVDPLGTRALAEAAVMQTLGYLIIRKIVRIKV